jgi:hypothetical protein
MRIVLTLIVASAVAATVAGGARAERVPIRDAVLRVAYFGAPLITNRQARAVPRGITKQQLFKRLHGRSTNRSGTHSLDPAWKVCIVYPVKGTGVKYPDGFVSADEWEFCFGLKGQLRRKFFTRAHHI